MGGRRWYSTSRKGTQRRRVLAGEASGLLERSALSSIQVVECNVSLNGVGLVNRREELPCAITRIEADVKLI